VLLLLLLFLLVALNLLYESAIPKQPPLLIEHDLQHR
jgi:hypothetical protein